jgi:hypothetical protein
MLKKSISIGLSLVVFGTLAITTESTSSYKPYTPTYEFFNREALSAGLTQWGNSFDNPAVIARAK